MMDLIFASLFNLISVLLRVLVFFVLAEVASVLVC